MEHFYEGNDKTEEELEAMPIAPWHIATKADRLIEYIDSQGIVPSTKAARELNMSLDQVYNWALPLEKKELLKLRYSILRGLILVSKKMEKEVSLWKWL